LTFEHALVDIEFEESGEDVIADDGEGQICGVFELESL
jgi:hypothetical protein